MTLTRVFVTWLILAILMPLNGMVRELFLKRIVPPDAAEGVSALLGIAIILAVTWRSFRDTPAHYPALSLLAISGILVGLTVIYESAIGLWVDHKTWEELIANYRVWEGHPWPLVLLTLAVTPFLWRRAPTPR